MQAIGCDECHSQFICTLDTLQAVRSVSYAMSAKDFWDKLQVLTSILNARLPFVTLKNAYNVINQILFLHRNHADLHPKPKLLNLL